MELGRLMQSINRVNDVISERIEHYNFGKSDNLVNQDSVFNQESAQELDPVLADNVAFWKQIEQIHLIKINVRRFIDTLETLGVLDFTASKYDHLRPQWEEFGSLRRSRILNLKIEAIEFEKMINRKFTVSVLLKLNQVNHL